MSELNPGRHAAARALVAVEQGAHVRVVLDEQYLPDGRDRGLANHLCMGVLRNRGSLDAMLAPVCTRPLEQLDEVPRACMRMGLFEALQSRVRTDVAVDQAVQACVALGMGRAKGMVNAVLRKAVQQPWPDDPSLNLPEWLAERWAHWPEWVATMTEQPRTGVMMRDAGATPEFLHSAVEVDGAVLDGSFWLDEPGVVVPRLPGFEEGAFWVMDPSAAHVAAVAAGAVADGGLCVLDACAAPGGKTQYFASRGFDVTACDRSNRRLNRMRDNLDRTRLNAKLVRHDWQLGPSEELGAFDLVFVDAPCTSLGTVRRHPEVRWRVAESDPSAMAVLQEQVLRAASSHASEGGVVVYAVCSPMEEEGIGVVEELSDFEIVSSWGGEAPVGDADAHQVFVLRRTKRIST